MTRMARCSAASVAASASVLFVPATVLGGDAEVSPWRTPGFTVAPYGWVAGIDGIVGTDPGEEGGFPPRIDIAVDEELDQIGFMLYLEWRGERWTAFVDSVWANVSQDGTLDFSILPDSGAEAVVDGNVYEAAVGYRVLDRESSALMVYGGGRYYDIEVEVNLQGGILPEPLSFSSTRDWGDAVLGARWMQSFTDRWHATVAADLGWGESDQTWQWLATMGYQFDWGSIIGGYRQLHLDYETADYKADLTLGGPLLGVAFRF